jgi:hypothetical protein
MLERRVHEKLKFEYATELSSLRLNFQFHQNILTSNHQHVTKLISKAKSTKTLGLISSIIKTSGSD